MPADTVAAAPPRYVLLEDREPIGPQVVLDPPARACDAVYGFSGKLAYDRFIANSEKALRPYPLIKSYLRNQIAAESDDLQLMVIDAVGPLEPTIAAATMEAALTAQTNAATQMNTEYQLNLDRRANTYRLTASSSRGV